MYESMKYSRSPNPSDGQKQNDFSAILADAFLHLEQREVTRRYRDNCLRIISYFLHWLKGKRIPAERISQREAELFLRTYNLPGATARGFGVNETSKYKRTATKMAVTLLQKRYRPITPPSPIDIEISGYAEHMRRNRGLSEGTIENHERALRSFFEFCKRRRRKIPASIRPTDIQEFVTATPTTEANSPRRMVCTSLRGYFRYLEILGRQTIHLRAAVPIAKAPRYSLSPDVPSCNQIETLLRAIDRRTPVGKRDFAAILFMSSLGMRVGDVARLELDDIDWRTGTVRVRSKKSANPCILPLPVHLGRALTDYLKKGRPSSRCRGLFLLHQQGTGDQVCAHTLKSAVSRAWQRAGLSKLFSGTHILRHSAATRMKRSGVALKTIADTLGQGSLQTVVVYAQVDLPALRRVAQPWPKE